MAGDVAVHRCAVRRGCEHERDAPAQLRVEQRRKVAAVTGVDLAGSCGALRGGEVQVGAGEGGPARLVLDADRAPVEVDGFDQGGADPTHRVDDDVAGIGCRR